MLALCSQEFEPIWTDFGGGVTRTAQWRHTVNPMAEISGSGGIGNTGSTNVASSFACKQESHDELMAEEKTLPDVDLVEDHQDDHDRDH